MPAYSMSAIGRDRPGIVAAVAEVLFTTGCNVEDSSMTLLRGNFAMTLVVQAPDGLTADDLRQALAPACGQMGMLHTVSEVVDTHDIAHPTHMLTVYGADHPGILYRFSRALADRSVNITDLDSRLVGSEKAPLYALMLEIALTADQDAGRLEAELKSLAAEQGVEASLNELDDDVL